MRRSWGRTYWNRNRLAHAAHASHSHCLPEVPGCGFASFATAVGPPSKAIAEGLTLRTERFELTVSKKTGGIQSLRTLRDRNTRVSQRLVFHHQLGEEPAQTQMVADRVEVSRNDSVVGEITSQGRVLGAAGDVLAKFTQRVRAVRGLPAMIVDVELDPQHLPAGDIWKSYFASRLAWSVESLSIRRGKNWSGLETTRECIDSSEWVEIDDGIGHVTCFALGLPFHRVAGPQWLDTLLLVAGEERRRFQFAIGIDQSYPTHAALSLLSACDPYICASPASVGFAARLVRACRGQKRFVYAHRATRRTGQRHSRAAAGNRGARYADDPRRVPPVSGRLDE